MRNPHHLAKSLSLGLPLLLCSCVDAPSYPAQWAAPAQTDSDACQGLAGTYRDEGEPGDPTKQPQWSVHLSRYLLDTPDNPEGRMSEENIIRRTDRIQIIGEDKDVLKIQLLNGKEILRSLQFSEANSTLKYDKDGVVINSYSGLGRVGNPVAGYEHDDLTLRKAADGALVVRNYSTTSGLVFMLPIPVSSTEARWSRFPIWKPTEAGNQ